MSLTLYLVLSQLASVIPGKLQVSREYACMKLVFLNTQSQSPPKFKVCDHISFCTTLNYLLVHFPKLRLGEADLKVIWADLETLK